MKAFIQRQRGVVLAVTLFMLALLTIIGVSAVMLSTTHFRLVGNLQAEQELERELYRQLEIYISRQAVFDKTKLEDHADHTQQITLGGRTVTVSIYKPRYLGCIPEIGGAATGDCPNPIFDVAGCAQDSFGTRVTAHWGVAQPGIQGDLEDIFIPPNPC